MQASNQSSEMESGRRILKNKVTILHKHFLTGGFLQMLQRGNIISKISGDSVV